MNGPHTHYDNLKVTRNAPPEVIRAAYKTLCQQFHPDRHDGHPKATQTFQIINAAYEVLSDPDKRRQHDEWIVKAEAREQARRAVRTPPRWNGQGDAVHHPKDPHPRLPIVRDPYSIQNAVVPCSGCCISRAPSLYGHRLR